LRQSITIQESIIYVFLFISTYTISIIPLSNFLFQSVYYTQIGLFFLFCITLLDFNKLLNYRLPLKQFRYFFLGLLLLVFLATSLINYKSNSDIPSIAKLLTYVFSFSLFFIYLPKVYFKDSVKMEYLLNAIIIFAIINSLFGWFSLFSGIGVNTTYAGYFLGLFKHPNTTGFVYSISIPVLFYKFLNGKLNIWLFSILASFFIICLLFTYSRSAYIAAGLSFIILTMFRSKRAFLLSGIVLLFVIIAFAADFFASKGGLSSISRIVLYITAYDMIMTNTQTFLWGYGVFRSLELFFVEKLFYGSLEIVVDPHNFILLLGIQFGMVLTITFFAFIIYVLISSFRKRKSQETSIRHLVELSFAIVIGLLVQNIFEDIMVYPEYFVFPLFLLFLGMMFRSISKK